METGSKRKGHIEARLVFLALVWGNFIAVLDIQTVGSAIGLAALQTRTPTATMAFKDLSGLLAETPVVSLPPLLKFSKPRGEVDAQALD